MGGQNTEINERTVDVLIESAYFKPQNIRATSKKLELRTESSYRFERGADVGICDWASRRAAQLILETAGGQLAEGVVDTFPASAEAEGNHAADHKICELLGMEIAPEQNVKLSPPARPGSRPRENAGRILHGDPVRRSAWI